MGRSGKNGKQDSWRVWHDGGEIVELISKKRLNRRTLTGCSIPVVRALRVRKDWVRFPAARRQRKVPPCGHFFPRGLGIERGWGREAGRFPVAADWKPMGFEKFSGHKSLLASQQPEQHHTV